jgi:hypothetical protein
VERGEPVSFAKKIGVELEWLQTGERDVGKG